MAQQQPSNQIQTIEITNFGGPLTRILNGDLNSGKAKFNTSWGYDPFSKPGNLTWLETPTSVMNSSSVMVLAAKPQVVNGNQTLYAVASAGNTTASLLSIQANSYTIPVNANLDSPSILGYVAASSPTFNYGASIELYQTSVFVGHDKGINKLWTDGSGDAFVGTAGDYVSNQFRPLKQFVGKLFFGNGNTIGAIDQTLSVTSSVVGTGQGNKYSELVPPLPASNYVHDIDTSIDGNYLVITSSEVGNEAIMSSNSDVAESVSSNGSIYYWNGSDLTVTAQTSIPSYLVSAMHTYIDRFIMWCNDAFGSSFIDQGQKLFTLTGNRAPLPNATCSNGSFISWANPEVLSDRSTMVASMYYYGSLDAENQSGLYRLCRISSIQTNGFIYQVPLNIMVNSKYSTFSIDQQTNQTTGYGKHYISVFDQKHTNSNIFLLYRFLVTPTGTGTPQSGVYETQTQLFGKKMTVKQIRVYTEPTASGNGFQIDCIGSDGTVVTNGTFTYTYASGTDITALQGSLERIDFNPTMKDLYALGIRITQTGTVNMTIKKIEIDWTQSGK